MTDPTTQTSGGMLVALKNLTNVSYSFENPPKYFGLAVKPNPPTYTPINQPPPSWTEGKQYQTWTDPAYTFGAFIPATFDRTLIEAAGFARAVLIKDMSAQTVVTNKQYQFTVDTPISGPFGGPSVRLFWNISGVTGGSTVMPGFGLYNLVTAPHAWTYVTPPSFTGDWSIELANPGYAEAVTLSVSYLAVRSTSGYGNASRLAFTIEGGSVTPYLSSEQLAEQLTPEHAADPNPQEILSPSDSYQVVRELQPV